MSKPVELYFFRYGSDPAAFYAYCDGPRAVTVDGVVYAPIPISRPRVPVSVGLDKTKLTVRLPISAAVVELWRLYPPGQVVTLTIRETSYDDPDTVGVVWVGRVLNCIRAESNDQEASLTCEPSSTAMHRTGLRRHYQLGCPHVLYGPLCRADRAAFTVTVPVLSLAYSAITLSPGWQGAFDRGRFKGGIASWTGPFMQENRTILRQESDTLYLTGPTMELLAGETVALSLGCAHTLANCETVFDNQLNYGGQPWIPLENPMTGNPF